MIQIKEIKMIRGNSEIYVKYLRNEREKIIAFPSSVALAWFISFVSFPFFITNVMNYGTTRLFLYFCHIDRII